MLLESVGGKATNGADCWNWPETAPVTPLALLVKVVVPCGEAIMVVEEEEAVACCFSPMAAT
jgi:hypothetical protein